MDWEKKQRRNIEKNCKNRVMMLTIKRRKSAYSWDVITNLKYQLNSADQEDYVIANTQ